MAKQLSGQVTVATAGTAVAGPNFSVGGNEAQFMIEALPTNTKNGVIGNDGHNNVQMNTGYVLTPGQHTIITTSNLNQIYFNVDTGGNGQGFCWYLI